MSVPAKAALIPAAVVPDDFRPYQDVPEGHAHEAAINGLSVMGMFEEPHLFEGTLCGDGLFCPDAPLLRSTFAAWAARVLLYLDGNPMGSEAAQRQDPDPLPPVQTSRFADVPASAWWVPHAHLLLEREATRGCGAGADGVLRFCGDRTVTRGQMASFLARIFDLPEADDAGFADVSSAHAHGANIDRLASWGITRGCSTRPLRFCADQPVTRGQMASFISRAVGGVGEPPEGYDMFVDVSATDLAVCGVRLSGKLECWDLYNTGFWGKDSPTDPLAYPSTDITDVPPGEFRDVELARQHACALRTDHKLVCWGYTQNRMGNFPEGDIFRQFSLNDSTGCGVRLRSQTIACWGIDSWNEPLGFYDVPRPNHWPQFTQVSAGGNIICALRQFGEVLCWGQDSWTDETGTYLLTRVPPGSYRHVAAGGTQACAVNTAGEIVCWGVVAPGDWMVEHILDESSEAVREMWKATPAAPPPGPFVRIYWSDFGHSAKLCGIKRGGTGLCWGNLSVNVTRQPPPGSRQYKPVFDMYFNTALDPGRISACGIRPRGHIECWGPDRATDRMSRWTIL